VLLSWRELYDNDDPQRLGTPRAVSIPAVATSERLVMSLQFHRAVEGMEIWSASSDDFSFVITYESPAGPGFHGRSGYVASWRPLYQSRGAIKIGGSPFKTSAEAEEACNAVLKHLTKPD